MDKTKTKLANFFNTEDDDEPLPKSLDEQKLSLYNQGTIRKSKREKEKEKEEAKKREEEELAAKTYAEFIDDFEGRSHRKGGGFVRAGGSSSDVPSAYEPSGERVGRDSVSRAFEDESRAQPRAPSPVSNAPRPKGKRAMDAFLEEIKRDQAERENRLSKNSRVQGRSVTALAAYESQSGSKDRGDPLTTNIFVANLPANANESVLGNFFATHCGPVGSVKVMWPRGDGTQGPGADMTATRSKKSAGLSGFVSFMKRKDAETAVRDMDGFDWGGSILRVGWSKAVPVAPKAAYVSDRHTMSESRSPERREDLYSSRKRSDSYSRERHRSRSRSRDRRYRSYSRSRSRSRSRDRRRRSRSHSRSYTRSRRYSRSRSDSRSPRGRRSGSPGDHRHSGVDPETGKFIRTVALKVKEHGDKFEDLLRERERQNKKFSFLFDTSTPENRLYRSIINGESLVEGFDDEGYNSVCSTDSAEESEREWVRKNKLGKLARKRFESMLRALSGRQGEVARCMAFSLEHAEAASEVSDIIVASLLVDSTPVPRKVARLHLICDILHNSAVSVPHAWKFRQEFQSRLGIVFDHLSSIYHSFPGRITAQTFKNQIMAVLDIWEDWIVFPPDYLGTLKSRLDGVSEAEKPGEKEETTDEKEQAKSLPTKFTKSSFKPAEVTKEEAVASTAPTAADSGEEDMDMDDSDAEPEKKSDNVDGEPMDDIDGEPMDDIDGEPLDGEPIDGEPLDGEPIDGEPIDDDIDGVPL